MSAAPPISVAPILGIIPDLGAAQRQCSTWPSAKERLHPWACRSAGTLHQAVAKCISQPGGRMPKAELRKNHKPNYWEGEVIATVERIEVVADLELLEIG